MHKKILFNLDLTSKGKFTPDRLEKLKEKILEIGEDFSISTVISETSQLTREGKIEIYIEDGAINEDSPEEVLSFIKSVESKVGGFTTGSYFSYAEEFSNAPVKWVREDYSWDLEDIEEDKSWDDGNYWENEWDEWNDEWN
jgi:hypothetical protein